MANLLIAHAPERTPDPGHVRRTCLRLDLAGSPFAGAPDLDGGCRRRDLARRYHAHLTARPDLIARLPELRGRIGGCWCRGDDDPRTPANVCHADVVDVWLDVFDDHTLRWLGGRPMPAVWADELEIRLQVLLGDGGPASTSGRGALPEQCLGCPY